MHFLILTIFVISKNLRTISNNALLALEHVEYNDCSVPGTAIPNAALNILTLTVLPHRRGVITTQYCLMSVHPLSRITWFMFTLTSSAKIRTTLARKNASWKLRWCLPRSHPLASKCPKISRIF